MKMLCFRAEISNHKILPTVVGLWAALLVSTVLPDAAFAQGPIEVLEEFMISPVDGPGYQAISGDIVVFDKNGDIYAYDLSTHTEFRITHHGGAQLPDVSGDTIVWMDGRNGNWDIYGYDLSEEREFQITNHVADQRLPVIDGNTVVWVDWRNGGEPFYGYDLYGYDLASGTDFRISGQSAPTTCPAISGDVVVWSDRRYGGWDVYGYDLGSGTEAQVTSTGTSSPYCPAISNGVIVFGEGNLIVGTDLSGHTLFQVTTVFPTFVGRPAIDSNLVVWHEQFYGTCIPEFGCPSTIVGYDINSDYTFLITSNEHRAMGPAISGNVVVWREWGSMVFPAYTPGVYVSKLLETVQLFVSPQFMDPGDVLTCTMALAEATTIGSHRSITDSLSSLATLDAPSLSATSGNYGYDPATHVITWTGNVSSYNPVTITYNATVNFDVSVGEHITHTAIISDQTTVFTCTVNAWVARRIHLPVITRSLHP